jgi:hypothetical protein
MSKTTKVSYFKKTSTNRYKRVSWFETELTGEAAAEKCFVIFNDQEYSISEFGGWVVRPLAELERNSVIGYKGQPMSVGDIARVDGVDYRCETIGWEIVKKA